MQQAVVRMRDVRFRWRQQDTPILDIPAFDVARGERVLIMGPSGSVCDHGSPI